VIATTREVVGGQGQHQILGNHGQVTTVQGNQQIIIQAQGAGSTIRIASAAGGQEKIIYARQPGTATAAAAAGSYVQGTVVATLPLGVPVAVATTTAGGQGTFAVAPFNQSSPTNYVAAPWGNWTTYTPAFFENSGGGARVVTVTNNAQAGQLPVFPGQQHQQQQVVQQARVVTAGGGGAKRDGKTLS
jgi:hypothetical protein